MSKITAYEEKKAELLQVQAVTSVTISQVEYPGAGGPAPLISIDGANPLFVKCLVKYLDDNKDALKTAVEEIAEAEVAAAKLEAVAEAESFIAQID